MSESLENKRILPLQFVKGVGPRRAEALAKEGIVEYIDAVLRVPRGYVERSAVKSIAEVQRNAGRHHDSPMSELTELVVTAETSIVAEVTDVEERTVGRNRKMLVVMVTDPTRESLELIYWNRIPYFKKYFEVGAIYEISGTPSYEGRRNTVSFTHPEVEKITTEDLELYQQGAILPKYSLTQGMRNVGINSRLLHSIAMQVLPEVEAELRETLPDSIRAKHRLMNLPTAVQELHNPTSIHNISVAQYRMKFEELFYFELMLATRHNSRQNPERGLKFNSQSARARTLVDNLKFTLTKAQRRVINEIVSDLSSGLPMNRLLQGDVGSGKTIVALLCMLCAIDNGYQTTIMVPTEILAEQHANTIKALVAGLDVKVVELTGGQRKSLRNEIKSEIASGEAQIIVGTHALFEADIEYHKLGLIVIDEQHRFGVAQRSLLKGLGVRSHQDDVRSPHILVMSATPIPRTLSMTLYGDLDVSIIDELPANRKPIRTSVVFESSLSNIHQFIREEVQLGRQAFVVYPLVEKSEKMELKSAVEHHKILQELTFPDLKVGLLHGQMLWYEKEDAMRAFLNKEYDVMVATTVVEVGIDIANASVMLIENAERFGLSQLHQLRGRVGRGADQSYCFLATKDHFRYQISKSNTSEDGAKAATRLKTMAETNDGFKIAEVDLALRGPGDMMGTRQSGLPDFQFANLVTDVPIIITAREEAFGMVANDPKLAQTEHRAVREKLISYFDTSSFYSVA
ncbi:MAG: ATP-dependent DNA helicase RecG [Ignavibacteria bacterium]|nr:ATP-dependent DNA helicase RecG [Ignavibacteria bacterium]